MAVSESQNPSAEFAGELHVSPRTVAVPLFAAGVILAFIRNPQARHPFVELTALPLGLLLLGGCAIAMLLDGWRPWAGRWFLVVLTTGAVVLVGQTLDAPVAWALLVIPTGLAGAMVGVLAAVGAALGQTALLTIWWSVGGLGLDGAGLIVTLVAVWATVGLMLAVYQPVERFAGWAWGCYHTGQTLLEEARGRKAELEAALADLAHLNRQLALTNERITMLRLAAEDAQAAKSRFVTRVSHELRAPLNIIIGLVRLIVEAPDAYAEELPPDLQSDLEVVYRNCQHLASMINDVLDLSQAEAASMVLHRRQVALPEIIESALAIVRPLIEKKGLNLRLDLAPDLPNLYCDPVRVRQVVLNLLTNAVRLTERGGITLRAHLEGASVVVGVSDTGPGIAAEDLNRIFEPFYAGARHLARAGGGSGLGLSISKQFIELHKGQMWCESELGKGATFYFRLPISEPPQPRARPGHQIREEWVWRRTSAERARLPAAEGQARPRFVIYDETGNLYSRLTQYSDAVEFVRAFDEAQALSEAARCPAHAVVLNVDGSDGLVGRALELSRRVPDTPILGCTVPEVLAHARAAGARGYLTKPVAQADLEQALRGGPSLVQRVLVVDDDGDFLSLMTRMLRLADPNLEIVAAMSAEDALERLSEALADLILLDLMLPGMSGWELLERLQADERTRAIPVYIVSAQDPSEQPLRSPTLVVTTDEGISISKLLACSLALSKVLLGPDLPPDPVPG